MTAKQHHYNAQEHKQAAKEEAVEGLQKLKDSGVDTGEYIKEKILEGVDAGKEGGQAARDNLAKLKNRAAGKAEEATATVKANVVTATSFLKTQVEQAQENVNEAYEAANSVAGEFAYQAAETAKAGVSKAGEIWKSSTDALEEKATGAQNAFLDSASKAKDKGEKLKAKIGSYFSEGRESLLEQFHLGDDMSRAWKRFKSQLYTTDRAAPPENNDREFITDFVNRYLKGKDIKMDPSELVSSIYDTLKDSKENVMNKIQDGANYVQDQATGTFRDPKESIKNKIQDGANFVQDKASETFGDSKDDILNKVQDGANYVRNYASENFGDSKDDLLNKVQDGANYVRNYASENFGDSKDDVLNKIQDGANYVHNYASETFRDSKENIMNKIQDGTKFAKDQATGTYKKAKDYTGIDYNAFADSLNEAYKSTSKSPKKIWKSVYYKLCDSNHPLADSISGFAKTPIPITSFYLSFFSFLVCYTILFRRQFGCPVTNSEKQVTPDQSSIQAIPASYSFYNFMSDNFAWAPMAFINILVLEINGYSNFVVHTIASLILSMEGLSQFCPAANHYSIKVAIISVVMLSSIFNFFTALTGFPIIG